ncbi:GNAT family N-acetyltransferase [Herbaspirillum sp. NPDC087042]|uniref:GNAT family N-acetyltransferase n=1 Tax=Herbaspirillum sp. NPDC087042 TaxID=3364004 RepID=UPI0037FD20A5
MDTLTAQRPVTHPAPPGAPAITLAEARPDHIPAILEIYSVYVLGALCTFEELPPSLDEMHRRLDRLRRVGLPWLVALEGDSVVGYAYASPYRSRPAYNGTVEDSIYVRQGQDGRGIGRTLLDALVRQCRALGYREMIAVVGDSANTASLTLHERMGFRKVGVLTDVGRKFNRAVDTVLMQRTLV